jgi:hypothetical protein
MLIGGTTGDDLPVLFPPRDDPLSFLGDDSAAATAAYFDGGASPADAIKKMAVDMTMHEPARLPTRSGSPSPARCSCRSAWVRRMDAIGPRPSDGSRRCRRVSGLVLLVCAVVIVVAVWSVLGTLLRTGTVTAIALIALVGPAAGHVIGGPDACRPSRASACTRARMHFG